MHYNTINAASNANRPLLPMQSLFSQSGQAAVPSTVMPIALQIFDPQRNAGISSPLIPFVPGHALSFPGHLGMIPPVSPSFYPASIPFVAQQALGFPQRPLQQNQMRKRGLDEEEGESDSAGKRQMLSNQPDIINPTAAPVVPLLNANSNQTAAEPAIELDEANGSVRIKYPNGDDYHGEVVEGKPHGQGVFCRNGIKYEGQFHQGGLKSGVIKLADGTIYLGKIVDWKPQGEGTWICMNGKIYQGNFRLGLQGILTGFGTMKLPNGNIYSGYIMNGEAKDKGELRTRSGEIYRGTFSDNHYFTGHFISNNQQKIKRSGVFEKGKFLMSGTIHFENGDVYIGDVTTMGYLSKAQSNGYGMLIRADQSKFQGTFKLGKIEKIETIYFPNGDQYEGETRDFQAHGKGTFTYLNGIKLTGTFVNGDLQGNVATIEYPNGDRYEGEAANRMAHGHGILTCMNGKRYEGEFENGLPVSLYRRP